MKDLICLLGLLVQLGSTHGRVTCNTDQSHLISCNEHGCCGTFPYGYCCDNQLDGEVIIGIVLGCLTGALLLITIIVCIIKRRKKSFHIRALSRTIQSTAITSSLACQGYDSPVYDSRSEPPPYYLHRQPLPYDSDSLPPPYDSHLQPPPYGQQTFDPPAYDMAPSSLTIQTLRCTVLAADEKQQRVRLPQVPKA